MFQYIARSLTPNDTVHARTTPYTYTVAHAPLRADFTRDFSAAVSCRATGAGTGSAGDPAPPGPSPPPPLRVPALPLACRAHLPCRLPRSARVATTGTRRPEAHRTVRRFRVPLGQPHCACPDGRGRRVRETLGSPEAGDHEFGSYVFARGLCVARMRSKLGMAWRGNRRPWESLSSLGRFLRDMVMSVEPRPHRSGQGTPVVRRGARGTS